MKKFIKSWLPWCILISLGSILWIISYVLPSVDPLDIWLSSGNKGIKSVTTNIYSEVKIWIEFIGRCMLGIGGIAGTIKVVIEMVLQKKRRKGEEK